MFLEQRGFLIIRGHCTCCPTFPQFSLPHLRSQYSCFSLAFLSDSSFGGDFLAGLTVACILIPQSVSYGTSLSRLTPTAGLVCHTSHFASSCPPFTSVTCVTSY